MLDNIHADMCKPYLWWPVGAFLSMTRAFLSITNAAAHIAASIIGMSNCFQKQLLTHA